MLLLVTKGVGIERGVLSVAKTETVLKSSEATTKERSFEEE
jgi:hypothetical protein